MSTRVFFASLSLAAVVASGAVAQTAETPAFETFDNRVGTERQTPPGADAPPGVDLGYSEFGEREIELVRPFGDDVTDSRGQPFSPLNEFAGQARPYEPGLIGDALGRVKRSIAGSLEDDGTR